jgi:hypothetical protein
MGLRIGWTLLLAALVLLAACSGEQEPEATPTPSASTATPLVQVTITNTPAVADATAVLTPTAEGTLTVTIASNGPAPLEVEQEDNCAIESNLDLAGYPRLEEKLGCPLETATFAPIAINEFGPGPNFDRFMLWFSDVGMIYVLYPDGHYELHEDTWEEGDPTFACNPTGGEAESPPLPRRGFGKLWCANPEIQEILGTVVKEERLCQHAVVQQFELGRLLACFEDATIRYFRLLDDKTWDVVVQ